MRHEGSTSLLGNVPGPLRSVLAVILGYVVMAVVYFAWSPLARLLLHIAASPLTPRSLGCNLVGLVLAAFAGGWATSRLASFKPAHHGLAMAMLLAFVLMGGLLRPAPLGMVNYQLLAAVLPPFAALLGAAFAARGRTNED